jgi:hypothetical protein
VVTHLSRWERAFGWFPWPCSRLFHAYVYIKVSRRRGWPYSLRSVCIGTVFGVSLVGDETPYHGDTSMPLIPIARLGDWLDRRFPK